MEKNDIWDLIYRNRGKIGGVFIGASIAICILPFGFFPSLFVFACAGVGLYFGAKRENRERFLQMIAKLINNGKDN